MPVQQAFTLAGISLGYKTSNQNEQAAIDCSKLWQRFEQEGIFAKIPHKLSNEVLAVYYNYDGDHTAPYAYFIGCKIAPDSELPEDLERLIIPEGHYKKIVTTGKMPDCIASAWRQIWQSPIQRAYSFDYELYDERCADWNNAEIDIYLALPNQ